MTYFDMLLWHLASAHFSTCCGETQAWGPKRSIQSSEKGLKGGKKPSPKGSLVSFIIIIMELLRPELEDQLNSREGVLGRDMSKSPEMCDPVCREKVLRGQGSCSTPWVLAFLSNHSSVKDPWKFLLKIWTNWKSLPSKRQGKHIQDNVGVALGQSVSVLEPNIYRETWKWRSNLTQFEREGRICPKAICWWCQTPKDQR